MAPSVSFLPAPMAIPCLLFLTFAFVPIAIVVLPCAKESLPIATLSSVAAFALYPMPTLLFVFTFTSLPKPTAQAPLTDALEPYPTDVGLRLVGTSFAAKDTPAFVIARAAKIPATTIFFLPLLFFANSETTT